MFVINRGSFLTSSIDFFKNRIIDTKTGVDNVCEMFHNAYKHYATKLRASIDDELRNGNLQDYGNPVYYTYLIMDGTKLQEMLKIYSIFTIINKNIDDFCGNVLYGGKGKSLRKFEHAIFGKLICTKQIDLKKISAKFSKISQIWERGHGITILQLPSDCSHHEAHSREYAIIKSLGLNNITNVVNGTRYGDMRFWNENEVSNFGKIMLYNALVMCVMEPPRIIYMNDVVLPKQKTSSKDWELQGILECFLDL